MKFERNRNCKINNFIKRGAEIVKKRWSLITVLILWLLFLSGCAEVEYHLTINKDASADVQYKIGMNSSLLSLLSSDSENPLETMRSDAESQGYKVVSYNNDQIIGIIASKHFKTLEKATNMKNLFANADFQAKINGDTPLRIEKGFFIDRFFLDGHIDLTDMKEKPEDGLEGLGNAMLSQIKMRFIITLPYKATNHNASSVKDNGNTLEWQLIPGMDNKIQLNTEVPNIRNIILCAVGGILLIIIAGVTIAVLRKKSKT